MTHAGSSPGPSAAPQRFTGRFSGFSYEAERCPACGSGEQLKGAAGGGFLAYGLTLLLGASPAGRLLAAGVGAIAGALASQWHLRVDWDPEALRGASSSSRQEA